LTTPIQTPGASFEAFGSAVTLELPRRRHAPLVLGVLALALLVGVVVTFVVRARSSPPLLATALNPSGVPALASAAASTTVPAPSSDESVPVLHVDDLIAEPASDVSATPQHERRGARKQRATKQPRRKRESELLVPY
jgi:hypothetical protein